MGKMVDDEDDGGGKRESYARNPEFLGQAFSLFCKGLGCGKIAEALSVEWPGAVERTVRRAATAHGWDLARAQYLGLLAEAQKSVEGLVPEVILQLGRLRIILEGRLATLNAMEMSQYRGVLDDLLVYTGKHPKLRESTPIAVGTDLELKAFLEVLQGDEVVGPALKKRRVQIEREWKKRVEGAGAKSLDAKTQRAQRGAKKSGAETLTQRHKDKTLTQRHKDTKKSGSIGKSESESQEHGKDGGNGKNGKRRVGGGR